MDNHSKTNKKFGSILKDSEAKTPWHIMRLLSFLASLAVLCLPMFYAGHKNVSLITFAASIRNHGIDLTAILSDRAYLFAVSAIICVVIFGIAEIICSFFTSAKSGYKRDIIAFSVNFGVTVLMSFCAVGFGARAKAGLILTLLIYFIRFILQNAVHKKGVNTYNTAVTLIIVGAVIASSCFVYRSPKVTYTPPKTADCDISAVTFNVAAAFGEKLDGTSSAERCDRFASYMNSIKPDIIGTQEMNSIWLKKLKSTMPDYENYGVKRGGDSEEKNSEMNAVFWNKTKFSAVEKNTIWLSETPKKESKYTYTDKDGNHCEAGCYRICSYVVLLNKQTGKNIIFLNTHLDNASEQAANFGANVVMNKLNELKEKYNNADGTVLTGDFNETQDGTAYKLVASKLNDCTNRAKKTATYQEWGYRSTGNEPIDFIFTDGKAVDYTVLNDLNNGYVSDHYGVYSGINF